MQRQAWQSIAEIPFGTALLSTQLRQMATAEFEEAPYNVVYTENKVNLRHYEPADGVRHEMLDGVGRVRFPVEIRWSFGGLTPEDYAVR